MVNSQHKAIWYALPKGFDLKKERKRWTKKPKVMFSCPCNLPITHMNVACPLPIPHPDEILNSWTYVCITPFRELGLK